jgi:trimethylamine--corrinoid protein Co-methyltransferase
MFAGNPRTLERMTDAAFLPTLADRKPREQWAVEGASTIHQRAMNRALDILSQPNAAALAEEVDARVRVHFDGLVAGDSALPEGWVRQGETAARPQRERRVNRRRGGSGT